MRTASFSKGICKKPGQCPVWEARITHAGCCYFSRRLKMDFYSLSFFQLIKLSFDVQIVLFLHFWYVWVIITTILMVGLYLLSKLKK
jgi:hypothetical protein